MPSEKPKKTDAQVKPESSAPPKRRETNRDFIEQIVIAFILAFVVRGFEAEAFVIPTGSMAPTLMGAHKDVDCPSCGFNFTVNAADEFTQPPRAVQSGLCSNCHAPISLDKEPSFNGDRILVMKYLLNMPWLSIGQPKRWDVIVFHYPGGPETNYIKRLVGLPGEDLRIYFGDILTRRNADEPYHLERKPLTHQEAMQINVWDDRHRPKALANRPEWARWHGSGAARWTEAKPSRFETEAHTEWAELRYSHLAPSPAQWNAINAGRALPYPAKPRLVTDFYGYNAGTDEPRYPNRRFMPEHWIGDLTLAARIEAKSDAGAIKIELVEAGIVNRCEIDVATGQARLFHGDQPMGEPANTPFKGKGAHDVRFANVDGRLTLWVDGKTPFGDGVVYQEGMDGYAAPTAEDLEPARVAARDSSIVVSDLVLTRDIYYSLHPKYDMGDYQSLGVQIDDLLSDPSQFPLLEEIRWRDFTIQPKHYMMLGDNSPRSADARAWTDDDLQWDPERTRQDFEVPEQFLIGKAFFVYWPHGKPFWPNLPFFSNNNFRLPFRPNFERMKWIR